MLNKYKFAEILTSFQLKRTKAKVKQLKLYRKFEQFWVQEAQKPVFSIENSDAEVIRLKIC
jgi:hypothetical protein